MKKGGKKRKMGPWPRLQKFWDIRAACNFIGGGTGSSLLMIAAIFVLMDKTNFAPIIAGFVFVSFGLFMVFLEIGRPWRSINMFFHPQTSWMTREGIVVMPLFLSTAAVVFYNGQVLGEFAAMSMGFFAMVFLYCQVQILHAARGIVSWNHSSLKPYIFITGITEALGIAVCLPGLNEERSLWLSLAAMLVIRLVLWKRYTAHLERDGAPESTCTVFEKIYSKVLFAHLWSLVLLSIAWFFDVLNNPLIFSMTAGLVATGIGWYVKAVLITRAAQTRGFAIPRTPVRGQGISKILGRQR